MCTYLKKRGKMCDFSSCGNGEMQSRRRFGQKTGRRTKCLLVLCLHWTYTTIVNQMGPPVQYVVPSSLLGHKERALQQRCCCSIDTRQKKIYTATHGIEAAVIAWTQNLLQLVFGLIQQRQSTTQNGGVLEQPSSTCEAALILFGCSLSGPQRGHHAASKQRELKREIW